MTDVTVRRLDAAEGAARIGELVDVLTDCVAGGASVGFLRPLERETVIAFWLAARRLDSEICPDARRCVLCDDLFL